MTTTELLIFDCDGVLIDSEPASSRVFCRALQKAGVEITPDEVHRRFTGYSETDAMRICREEFGLDDVAAVFAESRSNLYDEFARSLSPMQGMPQLIRSLPHRKCVASNSTLERLKNSLGLFDLWNAFGGHVFSAEMVARPKPAPDLFLLCASRLGVDPTHCIVVDDSPHGIVGAVAAGMRAIGFIDPADPRDDRQSVLARAGASWVATGADELAATFDTLLSASPCRVPAHEPAAHEVPA